MKTRFICLSIFAAALAAAGSVSAAPVVLNGSFEAPDFSAGGTLAGTVSSGGAFWTPSSSSVYLADNATGLGITPYGSQFLALNPTQSDAQSIGGFNLGSTYTFSGYFADLINGTNPSLTVTLSGVVSLSQTFTAPVAGPYGNTTIPFVHVQFTFTVLPSLGGAGTVVPNLDGSLMLTLTDASTNGTIGVDNIAIAVPEPGSVMAAFLGLSAVGCAVVKRRTKQQS